MISIFTSSRFVTYTPQWHSLYFSFSHEFSVYYYRYGEFIIYTVIFCCCCSNNKKENIATQGSIQTGSGELYSRLCATTGLSLPGTVGGTLQPRARKEDLQDIFHSSSSTSCLPVYSVFCFFSSSTFLSSSCSFCSSVTCSLPPVNPSSFASSFLLSSPSPLPSSLLLTHVLSSSVSPSFSSSH